MDELTLDDKIYISSKRAAAITGYAKDYVGQLCREGRVEARLVGRSWYVLEESIRTHRFGGEISQEDKDKQNDNPVENVSNKTKIDEKANENEVIFEHRYFQEEIIPLKEIEKEPQTNTNEDEHQILAMQDAWKEWFDSKKEPVEQVSNTIGEDINKDTLYSLDNSEEKQSEVPLHIIRDIQQQPEPEVDNITPVVKEYIHNEVVITPVRQEKIRDRELGTEHSENSPGASYVLLKAILVSILLVVVSITVISTGIVQSAGVQTSGVFMILSGETKI